MRRGVYFETPQYSGYYSVALQFVTTGAFPATEGDPPLAPAFTAEVAPAVGSLAKDRLRDVGTPCPVSAWWSLRS